MNALRPRQLIHCMRFCSCFGATFSAALLTPTVGLSAATPLQIAQQAYLKASNTGANDWFGYSVAVSGNTVVVGAYQESSNATSVNGNQSDNSAYGSGAASVFVRRDDTWVQQAYLKASNAEARDQFGFSVAISGDIVVIGAPQEASNATGVNGNQTDNSAANSGAAYIFVRQGTNWTQQAYLKASNAEGELPAAPVMVPGSTFQQRLQNLVVRAGLAGDKFGSSVSASEDTIVIGAPGEDSNATGVNGNQRDNSATNSGAAYVFVRSGTNWTQQAYVKASNTGGFSNVVSGQLQGIPQRAIRPPPGATAPASTEPARPIPTASPATPGIAPPNAPPTPRPVGPAPGLSTAQQAAMQGDAFGSAVVISGNTMVIGAPYEASSALGVNGNQADNNAPGSGAAYLFVRTGTNWTQQAYFKASNTGTADQFGQSLALSGDTVVVTAPGEASRATGVNGDQGDNSGPGSGAAYVFARTGTNWSQQAFLKPANSGTAGQSTPGVGTFADRLQRIVSRAASGISVAIAGDTVVVGSRGEDSLATGVNGDQTDNHSTNSGAAYIFVRHGTNWTQQAYLKAHNTGAGDEFGGAVAMSGNLVVVGANAEASSAIGVNGAPCDNSARNSGAAYIFDLNASLVPAAALTPPEIAVEQPLGTDLRDGAATVDFGGALVGSTWQQRAFTIRNTGTTPLTISNITITGANSNDLKVTAQPAESVSGPCGTTFTLNFSPNALGTRTATLHIASNDSDESSFDITLTGTGLTPVHIAQQAYLKASNTGSNDLFGFAVAVSGNTVVVGADQESSSAAGANGDQSDNRAPGAGAAYVFVHTGTTWTRQAYLKASNTGAGDRFGRSVAVSGDLVVVGATWESSNATSVNGNQNDNSATNAGAAYVFVRHGTTWSQQAYLKASNAKMGDEFGWSVAVSGDTAVVGALWADCDAPGVNSNQSDNSATDCGAAYVFVRQGTRWTQQASLRASNAGNGDSFAWSLALSQDTIVVGARSEDSNATGVNGDQGDNSAQAAGAAYVFVRNGGTWSQQAYLKASNTRADGAFGHSVSVSGDTAVVGTHRESSNVTGVNGDQSDNSASNSGAAYVFTRHGTKWTQQAYLKASNNRAGGFFGFSVAVSGDAVVVGSPYESSNAAGVNGDQSIYSARSSGAAYVFMRKGTNWIQQAYLKASNTGAEDLFGWGVALWGTKLAIGAMHEDSSATDVNGPECDRSFRDAGAAYIFELNADPKTVVTGPPEIAVEQPAGKILVSGAASVDFGSVAVPARWANNMMTMSRTFTIRNTGHSALTNLKITLAGADSNDFRVTAQPAATVYGPCGSTSFTVSFMPTTASSRTATLHISNNDPDESSFDITLTGTGTVTTGSTYTPYAFTNFAGMPGEQGSADGTGSGAQFSSPSGVAVDGAGNIYVADLSNHTIRKVTPAGALTTLAGSPGQAGSTDGIGSAARFNRPEGVAVDGAGNVYVADFWNHTIRKITPAGEVTTLAGSAQEVGSADGPGSVARFGARFQSDGPRPQERFAGASGVALDGAGNVYVTDEYNHTIRRISPVGVVTTLAGSAGQSGSADGIGSAARFHNPHGVAVDNTGNVYVGDRHNHIIRKITPAGVVTTLAGNAGQSGGADGIGSAARFTSPHGVAVDREGNMYVADLNNSTIRKITPAGVVTTLAGNVGQRGNVDGLGGAARFGSPYGVAVDSAGNVYVTGNYAIRKITPAGAVTALAVSAGRGDADGAGSAARFYNPVSVAVDSSGNVYVADQLNNAIRKTTPAGVVTTLAGSSGLAGSADGTGSAARFNRPDGVAVDNVGNVYVADQYNHTIRKITPAGVVTTLAGAAGQNGSADGIGSVARFFWPVGVAADRGGNVYVADSGNHTVRKIAPDGTVTTLAGGAGERGSADGTGSTARFGGMEIGGCHHDVAVDQRGNVYVADRDNQTIRKITPEGVVTTLAGTAGQRGNTDGIGSAARFNFPVGVAVDSLGNVYVVDGNNFLIRRITPAGEVTTLAGTSGQRGSTDGIGNAARFSYPAGVAMDSAGNVYVADRDNNRITKGTPVLTTAPGASVPPRQAVPGSTPQIQPVRVVPPPTQPTPVPPRPAQPRSAQTGAVAGEMNRLGANDARDARRLTRLQSLFKGKVSLRPDGLFEFFYDFSEPAQLDDWIIREPQAEWAVEGGGLLCKRNASRNGTDTRLYHRALFAGHQREIHYHAQGPHSLAAGLFAELDDWRRQYHFRLDGGRMGHERGGPPAGISAGMADLVTTNLGALDPRHTYRVDAAVDGDSISLGIDGRVTLQGQIPASNRQSGAMAYLKLAYWPARFDNVRIVGDLDPVQHELLFVDDFQDGLGRWTGGDGGPHSGVIIPDPLSSGRDRVLTFAERTWTGDVFTRELFTNAGWVEIRFDYLGLAKPGSVAGDLGGFFGIATERPHSSHFFAGTQDKHPDVMVPLVDDGAWHRVNYLHSGGGTSSFRLMIEDFIDSGGIAGDACFDNIQVRSVPVPPSRKR